jgi:hypothetical protein
MPLALRFAPVLTALLLAACADTTPTVTPPAPSGTLSAEISGDVTVTMPPGEARFAFVDDVDTGTLIPAHNELLFYQFADGKLYQVSLEFPLEQAPGTYDFQGAEFSEDAAFAALFSDYETGGEVVDRDLIDYNANISGMLTLDEVGATISGSYAFTAEADVDGEMRQVTVRGTFEDVPYIEP